MTRLSGRVPETGTAISGATVAIIDTQGTEDPTQWSIVASTTTDANGEWSVSGLQTAATERYHAVAQYDSGAEFVNFESLPYLSTPADTFPATTNVQVGSPTATVEVGSAIPDRDVYLQDDWGDNKLQNRDGSGTTTYNGVTGFYRPEWVFDYGNPTASNEKAVLNNGGDSISFSTNFDVSSNNITWEFNNVSYSSGNGIDYHLGLYTRDGETFSQSDPPVFPSVAISFGGGTVTDFVRLIYWDTSGSKNEIIRVGSVGTTNNLDFKVTRDTSGNYEIFINGSSEGVGTDNNLTTSDKVFLSTTDAANGDMTIGSMKIY